MPHPYARSDAESWVRRCREMAGAGARPGAYWFAIVLKADGAVIGGVSLSKIDWAASTAGGGIWLAGAYQGRGYGREAFEAKIGFAFQDLGLTKLINGYFDGDEASWAMQRKLGYRHVGEVAARCMADGRKTVEHVTMLLREDWDLGKSRSPTSD